MEILIAIILGYVLGILPFIIPRTKEIINKIDENKEYKTDNNCNNLTDDILNEWINGASVTQKDNKITKNIITPNDIFNEYLTGEEIDYNGR